MCSALRVSAALLHRHIDDNTAARRSDFVRLRPSRVYPSSAGVGEQLSIRRSKLRLSLGLHLRGGLERRPLDWLPLNWFSSHEEYVEV